jgi:hypothetical protein
MYGQEWILSKSADHQHEETTTSSFNNFVFSECRGNLWAAIILITVDFAIFKLMYPHANFMLDSTYYIDAAIHNYELNIWPIAYSKILIFFHSMNHTDFLIVITQYVLVELSILYFYFTLTFFIRPGKTTMLILLFLLLVNPAILSLANYILSDCIFMSLTLIWLTQMIWLHCKPSKVNTYLLAILLIALFILRYYAIFYPLFTFLAILSSKVPWKTKLISISLGFLLLSSFILYTSVQYKILIGKKTFSPFSGWQIASNAIIMYRNIKTYGADNPPQNLKSLDNIVIHDLDFYNHLEKRPDSAVQFYYMWNPHSPLRNYLNVVYKNDSTTPFFIKWSTMGPIFQEYGSYLIKSHPILYSKYFVGLDLKWFAIPIDESLGIYNRGNDSVTPEICNWFAYKSTRLKSISKNIYTLSAYPIIMTVLNISLILSAIGYRLFNLSQVNSKNINRIISLILLFWLSNLLFSIVSAPVMLRYQMTIMVLDISISLIVFEKIYSLETRRKSII